MEINFNLQDLALAAFASDEACDKYFEASDEFYRVWNSLFKKLLDGSIDYFYYTEKSSACVFTRSIKQNGKIQATIFWIKDGEWIALSDGQVSTAEEAERNFYGVKDHVTIQFS